MLSPGWGGPARPQEAGSPKAPKPASPKRCDSNVINSNISPYRGFWRRGGGTEQVIISILSIHDPQVRLPRMRDGEGSGPAVPAAGTHRAGGWQPDQGSAFLLPPQPEDASEQTHRLRRRHEPRRVEKLELSALPEAPLPQLWPAGVLLPRPSGPPSEERGSGSNLV